MMQGSSAFLAHPGLLYLACSEEKVNKKTFQLALQWYVPLDKFFIIFNNILTVSVLTDQ